MIAALTQISLFLMAGPCPRSDATPPQWGFVSATKPQLASAQTTAVDTLIKTHRATHRTTVARTWTLSIVVADATSCRQLAYPRGALCISATSGSATLTLHNDARASGGTIIVGETGHRVLIYGAIAC